MRFAKYFPVIRAKRKEFEAVRHLRGDVSGQICCVVDLCGLDDEKQQRERCHKPAEWGQLATRSAVAVVMRPELWSKHLESLLNVSGSCNVVGGSWLTDISTNLPSLRRCHERFNSGAIVCMKFADLKNAELMERLHAASLKIPTSVVVRMGYQRRGKDELATLAEAAATKLASLQSLTKIAVASGSYPEHNGDIANDSVTLIRRIEWDAWTSSRQPSYFFGDYGPVCGEPSGGGGGRNPSITPAIRYADVDSHVVFRGRSGSHGEHKAGMRVLARDLVDSDYYSGADFSWGDEKFYAAASAAPLEELPGGHAALRAFEWNHHLAITARGAADFVERQSMFAAPPTAGRQ